MTVVPYQNLPPAQQQALDNLRALGPVTPASREKAILHKRQRANHTELPPPASNRRLLVTTADLTVLARIALYVLTGYLASAGVDSFVVQYLRTDPQVLAAATGGLAAAWYGAARWFGWPT